MRAVFLALLWLLHHRENRRQPNADHRRPQYRATTTCLPDMAIVALTLDRQIIVNPHRHWAVFGFPDGATAITAPEKQPSSTHSIPVKPAALAYQAGTTFLHYCSVEQPRAPVERRDRGLSAERQAKSDVARPLAGRIGIAHTTLTSAIARLRGPRPAQPFQRLLF